MREPKEIIRRTKRFLLDVRAEVRKATWSTGKELVDSTMVVLVVFVIVAIFVGVVDYVANVGIMEKVLPELGK